MSVKVNITTDLTTLNAILETCNDRETAMQLLEGTYKYPKLPSTGKNEEGDTVTFEKFLPMAYDSSKIVYKYPIYRWYNTETPEPGERGKYERDDAEGAVFKAKSGEFGNRRCSVSEWVAMCKK